MSKIRILDDATIQKIAAGEIIERPASIVKELVENSIDAHSSNVTIEIRNGGKKYIRVTDDGDGLTEDDLKIAFKRYSTSKLNSIEELYKICSFGFRGEALASISAVSKVEVITRTKYSQAGIKSFVENNEILDLKPIGSPRGTTMIVRDLFYNLPVREGFLKSDTAEASHIVDLVYKLAIGNSGIAFKLVRDNKIVFSTSVNNDLKSNIYALLGKDFYQNLLLINGSTSSFNIYGYVSNNTFYRGNRNHQYLYVNNRHIKNKSITTLIENRYKSIIPINRFPIFVIFIDIDPLLIDVNIHPTKQEIQFINQKEILDALESAMDSVLNNIISIPEASINKGKQDIKNNSLPLLYENIFVNKDLAKPDDINNIIGVQETPYDILPPKNSSNKPVTEQYNRDTMDLNHIFNSSKIIGTIFSTFIILESRELDKVFLIDQHAAHEKILFEKYKHEFESEKIVIQDLLVPEIVKLSAVEIEQINNNIPLLNRLGFIVEEFGDNCIIIRGVPILFGREQRFVKLLLDILDTINSEIRTSYDVLTDKIMKMACSNAIKSGDNIHPLEIHALIEQLINTDNPYTCPHGRPVIIEISRKELEKGFRRIM